MREIKLNDNELGLFAMAQSKVSQMQRGLTIALSARAELIILLETKHNAKYSPEQDKFIPNESQEEVK